MKTMSATATTRLNKMYEQNILRNPDQSTHIVTHDTAIFNGNLELVRHDDESGNLYVDRRGCHVYGWESGGFSAPPEV